MCGIAGIITNHTTAEHELQLKKMLHVTKHRGPDASESWMDENCSLGHNRLSIIDLHSSANQPMHSNCGRYTVVFNGEIYNYLEIKESLSSFYVFKTQSDTEVLLAAFIKYGTGVTEKLNGMFSFVIWDKVNKKIVACRDRFGVKPFYYSLHNGNFYFASEIKALFAADIPKKENCTVWASYMVHGTYGMPNKTFWETIEQLPAGHILEITINQNRKIKLEDIKITQWYNFVNRVNEINGSEIPILKANYLELLNDSIAIRFRADVKVGFNISGGLDSSVLLAMVNGLFPDNKTIEAFTFYSNNENYDELPWVEKMIASTGNPINKCLLKAKEIDSLIKEVSYYQDEPFGGFPTLAYSLIFKEAQKKNILVLLDGQGMDEAWAGYDYYQTNSAAIIQGITSSPTRPDALEPEFAAMAKKQEYPTPFDNDLQNKQYRDIFFTKIPRALRFNDRISMMHSTELREPFLDYRLVELAFTQKPEIKIKNGQGKWLLRELMKQKLGDLALAPKRPLQTPQREWLAAPPLRNMVDDTVKSLKKHPWFLEKQLEKNWAEFGHGKNDNSFFVWQWINLNEILK